MYDILELNKKLLPELKEIAKELGIKKFEALKKQDLVYKILDTQAIQEAEKAERKPVVKEENKEENGIKAFLVKKAFSSENKNTQQEELRGNRPRRERIEPILKREKIETGKKKNVQKESAVQSRQEQIKAIIKGFGREKPPIPEPEQKPEVEKPVFSVGSAYYRVADAVVKAKHARRVIISEKKLAVLPVFRVVCHVISSYVAGFFAVYRQSTP